MKRSIASALAGLFLMLVAAGPSLAGGPGGDDMAFQFRLGGFFPRGDGEFWDGTESRFTLDHADFNDAAVGFSIINPISNHLEVGFNIDFYEATVGSAERDFTDPGGRPILHDTRFQSVPLAVDVRFLPAGRYRVRGPSSRFVRQPVFYVGGGVGLAYWEYEEQGDFVDDATLEIFFDRFTDTGVALETHVLAGVELPLGEYWSLMFESKYSWIDDELGNDFAGFGKIDLGGTSVFAGGSFRF